MRLQELQAEARRIDALVASWHAQGRPAEAIASEVCGLHARLFERLWSLVAPAELVAHSALLVMGSEGRGEQIVKTDQDNALLLRDGFEAAGLAGVAADFNVALADFGYPPCPGDIMLTNPLWRQPLADFRDTLRRWIYGDDPEGPMHLAIFLDAACVAGDARLLVAARSHLDLILDGQDTFLARFAAAADRFPEPGNWFTRLTHRQDELPLDLKKVGTFPIVHGTRALALEHGVHATGTAARLGALADAQRIDRALADALVAALHALMGLRLAHQLRQRAAGVPACNELRPSALDAPQREQLHAALAVVKRFRVHLRQHFRLDNL